MSFTTRRQSGTFPRHVFKPATTWPDDWLSIWDHGAKTQLPVLLTAIAAASNSNVTPDSEKKRCVKCGFRTKSWTQNRRPRTSSTLIATQSRIITDLSPNVTGPRLATASSWNAWNKAQTNQQQHWSSTQLVGDNTYFAQMAPQTETNLWRAESQDVPYVRAAAPWSPLQLPLLLHKLLTLWFARHHLGVPCPAVLKKSVKQHSKQLHQGINVPANQHINIAEQKQPNHWLLVDHAAMVGNTQFTKS